MSRQPDRLRRALRRLESDDPAELRAQAIQRLLDHTAADFGFIAKYVVRDETLLHGSFTVVGDREAARVLGSLEGQPSVTSSCWSPWKPRPVEKQRFVSVRHGPVSFEMLRKSEGYRLVYEPFGIEDHARILLYDGVRFLGWLGLMRGKHKPFDRCDLAILNRVVPEISAVLSAAEDLERATLSHSLHLVVEPERLRIEWASRHARAWLSGRRAEKLEELLRAFRQGENVSVASIAGREVRIAELVGEAGHRYHVHIGRADLPRLGPEGLLSPRQYEVAQYAAAGATTIEIAEIMKLSRYTVADHLKAIYARLGVRGRAEMAALLAEHR